jgi:hypothetical protein
MSPPPRDSENPPCADEPPLQLGCRIPRASMPAEALTLSFRTSAKQTLPTLAEALPIDIPMIHDLAGRCGTQCLPDNVPRWGRWAPSHEERPNPKPRHVRLIRACPRRGTDYWGMRVARCECRHGAPRQASNQESETSFLQKYASVNLSLPSIWLASGSWAHAPCADCRVKSPLFFSPPGNSAIPCNTGRVHHEPDTSVFP